MHPTLIKLGPVTLHTYGLLIALGFLVALHFMRRDARKQGIDPNFITDTAFWVLFLGLAGTRVLHILMFPSEYSWTDPLGWVAVWNGGLVFQGALPPAIAYCVWAVRRKQVPTWQFADVVSPYIPLGHAFGRMGCFMYGCCYGVRTDLPWGVRFPRIPADTTQLPTGSPVFLDHFKRHALPADAHWSHPVHPTQLYSVFGLLAICLVLVYMKKRHPLFTGFTFPLYLILYGLFRFVVEFFRGDHNPTRFDLISDQQAFALLMAVSGVVLGAILYLRERRAKPRTGGAR
jgi:phosphatidylglycerol:prolipoprotein diacylglycerol transferase